ncbi:MAG: hypothetical protein J2P22_12990 [Nocardioides sp.]|nr:hypothetical protein [Nocardioides sp.]
MLIADSGSLTDAAARVDACADGLADVDVAGPFSDVSDALVGSETSQGCLWLSTRLGAAVQVYAQRLHNLADASRSTATDLTNTDHNVAGAYGTGPR